MRPNLAYLNIIFSITLSILLILSAIFLNSMADLVDAEEKVVHTYKVIGQIDLLKNNLNKAESDVRGFLLTNDSSFLKFYESSAGEILTSVDTLIKLTPDNKLQQKKLSHLKRWARFRLECLEQTLAFSNDSSLLKDNVLLGKNAMDSCLNIFGVMKSEELNLLEGRNKTKSVYSYAAPFTFTIIFIFTLIIFITSFLFIAEALKRRAKYQTELEGQVLELNRMNSELNEFSFIASHNLQEPLRKLRVFSDRLSTKYKEHLNDEAKQIIARMDAAATKMHELMNDFINFINIHNTNEEISLVVLNDIIEKVASEIRNQTPEKPFSLRIAKLGNVHGYANQLHILFKCLLDNSVRYCRTDLPLEVKISGEIVSWKKLPENRNVVSNWSYYKITIADNGMGFDNIFSQKIFKLFQRLDNEEKPVSAKGTGLAIAEHIMIRHHGFVTASGSVEQGASFNLFFPMKS